MVCRAIETHASRGSAPGDTQSDTRVAGVDRGARAQVAAAPTSRPSRSAIRSNAGVAYLQRQQNPNGTWPDHPAYSGGITALCTLALLNAGIEPQQEGMQRALKQLRGLVARADLRRLVADDGLLRGRASKGFAAHSPQRQMAGRQPDRQRRPQGRLGYPSPAGGSGDPSNSQFARAGPLRSRARRRQGERQDLATGAAVLAENAEPGRIVALSGRPRHRQHDLRRHHLADHRLGRIQSRRCRSRRRTGPLLRRSTGQRGHRERPALAGAQLLGAHESAAEEAGAARATCSTTCTAWSAPAA